MDYNIRIQGAEARPREEVQNYLQMLPDVHPVASGYVYSDDEADITVELRVVGDQAQAEAIEALVPERLSAQGAERVAALCAGIAIRFGWEMKDPGTGAVLSEGAARKRLMGGAGLTAAVNTVLAGGHEPAAPEDGTPARTGGGMCAFWVLAALTLALFCLFYVR